MPRPKNKEELLETSKRNYDRLISLIDSYDDDLKQKEFPAGMLNRNIRDVIAHLDHWNKMTLDWYKEGIKGVKPEMPAKGYTWKTLPDLNKAINEKYNTAKLSDVRSSFAKSYSAIIKTISSHTNEELFEKKRYPWTGSTSMGAYFVSAASSHYEWAYKLIKKSMK